MNWEAVGAIGEVLGAIGVIATLGYLAVQIRQNTESLRATSELGLSQQSAGWMSRMAAQPELSRIYDAAAEDPTSLTPEEISRFRWVVGELFLIYEGHYQLYRTGHIAEISWKGKDQVMQGLLENPLVAEWWNRRMTPFSDEFYEYIERLRSSPGSSWTHQRVGSQTEPAVNDPDDPLQKSR